ncbi:MAG: cell division protein FtsA [candidate division Zixibacteria bacterium]|nr:cell division protein FtsA [candidate division Zixibacteria bacterium]
MGKDNVVVGLDIGTTKIGAVIGEVDEEGKVKIIGLGTAPAEGLKRGVVVNLEQTVNSIIKAVQDAELMAGVKAESIYAGIAGDHIRSINSRGVIAVTRQDHEITQSEIERAIEAAKTVAIPMDREIIHVLPQEFTVDDQSGIKDPRGMGGTRLEVEVHIVTGSVTSTQNIHRSVKRAGYELLDLVLEPLAESQALLTPEEIESGVVLIDIGGGTTNLAIFYDGCIRHTAVISLGGRNVTNDLAIGLRTPVEQAEELKKNYGCALASLADPEEMIKVPGVGAREPREVSRSILAAIIEPRMEEIFSLALRELKKTSFSDILATGVVLTGGGSLLEGTEDLAEQVFDMPVKKGEVKGVSGLLDIAVNPVNTTGIGLVLYGLRNYQGKFRKGANGRLFNRVAQRVKNFFGEYL